MVDVAFWRGPRGPRTLAVVLVGILGLGLGPSVVAAHTGALTYTSGPPTIPKWVFAVSGGGVVAISFLFSVLVTDRDLVHGLRGRRRQFALGVDRLGKTGPVLGVAGLLAVLVLGVLGPAQPLSNLSILLVWVAWWAGYTMSTYLLGNSWPSLDPWRSIAGFLPSRDRPYPERLGRWPAVAALLFLVFIEVVTPIADNPPVLSSIVLGYTVVTLGGAVYYGREQWFRYVDPIAAVFRFYGRLAPIQSEDGRLTLVPPTAKLADGGLIVGWDDVAFVIALLWVTTYDGLVSTPGAASLVSWAVGIGIPAHLTYAILLVGGFLLFLGLFWWTARGIRWSAETFVSVPEIASRFAPTLLPIAAAYHFAHFSGYFLELLPAFVVALGSPLSAGVSVPVLVLPEWWGGLQLAAIVVGHIVAVWAAHGTAFDVFTGRLQPIRSQYPLALLMVAYTMTSLWIIAQPIQQPAFV